MLKSTRPKTYYDTGRTTNMYTFDVVGWNNKQQHAIDLWKTQEQGLLDCMNHSKTARRRRLRSRSGYYLAIMPNGQIVGNKDTNCPHIEIDVIPHGADLVKLWAVEAELFLMIDDAGHMRGTDVDSAECIFQETFTENFFTVYYSYMYIQKRWCVGLRNKPQTRSFYRRIAKPTHDTSFVLEIVKRRFSGSSSDGSEAAST